jgi:long-chain acyl-CoA synthetase
VGIAYSKPIGKIMLADFKKIRPTWMTAVPRLWEGIRAGIIRNVNSQGGIKKIMFHFFLKIGQAYASLGNMIAGRIPQFRKRIRLFDISSAIIPFALLAPFKALGNVLVFKKLKALMGGRFVAGVSGGGALPSYVDKFFQAAGIPLLEGYGLTETAPILSVRYQHHPVSGTVGPLLEDVEYRLLDEEGNELPPGKMGTLYVKSPQVMQGYYKKPEETAKVLKDGWLNTGDLAVFTHTGECTIVGRSKDTIVLLGGENIEPNPIEENLVQSDYIEQAMVVGQDQKFLGALIVINEEKTEEYAKRKNIQFMDSAELRSNPEIKDLIYDEIQGLVNPKRGFKAFERIFRFTILPKAFEIGDEMTRSLKIRRNIVNERYKKEIAGLFK